MKSHHACDGMAMINLHNYLKYFKIILKILLYLNTRKFHKYETCEKILNVTIDYRGLLSTSLKLLLLLS